MYKTFVYSSGSSAMSALRKAFKEAAPDIEVICWSIVSNKIRLSIYSPLVPNANIALDIYKQKTKSREVIVKFKLQQDCMIPLSFEKIAEKLEEQYQAKQHQITL
jgi:hypothetical protein